MVTLVTDITGVGRTKQVLYSVDDGSNFHFYDKNI